MRAPLVLSILLSVLASAAPAEADDASRIRVILDTDANNELDDQHAIAYLLFSGDVFDVEGITVNRTWSGGSVDEHYAEAVRTVTLCGLYPHMPIYRGAEGTFEDIVAEAGETDFDGAEAVTFIIDRARADDDRPLVLLAVGKLTNVALALARAPEIASTIRIVWLGSNYPAPGEYNQLNDESAVGHVLESAARFEIALVREGEPTGTDAVRVTEREIRETMPGAGPRIDPPAPGRHGGRFATFGDYSVSLFEHVEPYGDPPSRALFDMAAVAIVKQPAWATAVERPAPVLEDGQWVERPDNPRTVTFWERFDRDAILADFYRTMTDYRLAEPAASW